MYIGIGRFVKRNGKKKKDIRLSENQEEGNQGIRISGTQPPDILVSR
jgi:hypothetical protein